MTVVLFLEQSHQKWLYFSTNNSDQSSIKTEYSSPGNFDIFTSSTDENLIDVSFKNSTSSSTINSSPRDPNQKYDEIYSENMEEISTTSSTSRQNVSTSSNNSFLTRTSTTETRFGTTTTDIEAKTTDTENESVRKTDITSYSDNSDSAYTNSHSIFTQTLNSNSETHRSVQEVGDRQRNESDKNGVKEERKESLRSQNLNESSTQTPNTANLNVISNIQLSESTLNVIFNHVLQDVNNKPVNSLNMTSLTAILQDENKENKQENQKGKTVEADSKIINVQPVPSFYLNRKEDIVVSTEHSRVIKYMISNVGTGSPYSKPAEIPQVIVPRYSALPRTSSMEVNTSSLDSTDRDSDTVSLVDSLEDGISPNRLDQNVLERDDDNPVKTDDLSALLPDNSDNSKKSKTPQKSAVFFIPIENKPTEDNKPVSYHLPARVKEKLSRRQLKREQKMLQAKSNITSPRSDSNYISASDNQISFTVNNNPEYAEVKSVPLLPEINNHKTRKKSRAILPSIQNIRKIKIDSRDNIKYTECERIRDRSNKPIKRRSITKYEKITSKNEPQWSSRNFHKIPEKLTPIYTSKNEYTCDTMPKEIYHKTEFANSNKRIEILEIMECLDNDQQHHSFPKVGKSKIPILVHNKLPRIEKKTFSKPVYLDFNEAQDYDPKMDQLIANILIDTLNKYENDAGSPTADSKKNILNLTNEKRPNEDVNLVGKYQQKFDVIPEELSRQSSLEDSSSKSEKTTSTSRLIETAADILTKNVLKNNNIQEKLYKTQSTKNSSMENSKSDDYTKTNPSFISGSKIEDVLTIPHGWITFYMLHKNQGSSDSSSDEGTHLSSQYKQVKRNVPEEKKEFRRESCNDYSKDLNTKSERIPMENSEEFTTVNKRDKSRRDTLDTILSSDAFSDNLNPVLPHTNNEQSSKQYSSFKNVNNTNSINSNNTRFTDNGQATTQGWSVTVSGMNSYGQPAPDVEMRLKFPVSKENADFGSQTKEEEENVGSTASYCYQAERSCQLLKRHNHQNLINSVVSVTAAEDNFRSGRLPIINQNRRFSQPYAGVPVAYNAYPTEQIHQLVKLLKKAQREQQQDLTKIPGVPGVDYPIYHSVPETHFSCHNVPAHPGIYANVETGCQAYHVCHDGREGHQGSSFLCANGTLFNQAEFTCDWWYNVNCHDATNLYRLNLDPLKNPYVPKPKPEEEVHQEYVKY
ncbi:hypothetical protein MML48_2g00002128 [Holotrichia oblita]|uniref:Uncharacterized protein n=1 Tax=Holotrichia oblita TaxID=644536 RepID=A0ACB9TJ27_HOLOL|nr:hypothetical protein MML48_2g00002128 [Holotrichia oblita]